MCILWQEPSIPNIQLVPMEQRWSACLLVIYPVVMPALELSKHSSHRVGLLCFLSCFPPFLTRDTNDAMLTFCTIHGALIKLLVSESHCTLTK